MVVAPPYRERCPLFFRYGSPRASTTNLALQRSLYLFILSSHVCGNVFVFELRLSALPQHKNPCMCLPKQYLDAHYEVGSYQERRGIPVVHSGFAHRGIQESGRTGFAVVPTAKYVDECLDVVQLQNAKLVVTTLTEQKSSNLHDETTVCNQVQHVLYSAVVGKLQ